MIRINLSPKAPKKEGLKRNWRENKPKELLYVIDSFVDSGKLIVEGTRAVITGLIEPFYSDYKFKKEERKDKRRKENSREFHMSFERERDMYKPNRKLGRFLSREEIEEQYPNSRLFKEEFKNIPDGFVSIFHAGNSKMLGMYDKYGLRGQMDVIPSHRVPEMIIRERDMDEERSDDLKEFSRSNSLYAYPFLPQRNDCGRNPFSPPTRYDCGGDVLMELKIDPTEAIVCDADIFSNIYRSDYESDKEYNLVLGDRYWASSMSLAEFLELSPEEQSQEFRMPEILLPDEMTIPSEHMRICEDIDTKSGSASSLRNAV